MTRVVLHIDQLILRGFERADAAAVSAGVQKQLKSMLIEPNAPASLTSGGDRFRIKAGTAQVEQAGGAPGIGRSIGRQIVKGMSS